MKQDQPMSGLIYDGDVVLEGQWVRDPPRNGQVDISTNNVDQMVRALRRYPGLPRRDDDAADMLAALSARIAELEQKLRDAENL